MLLLSVFGNKDYLLQVNKSARQCDNTGLYTV